MFSLLYFTNIHVVCDYINMQTLLPNYSTDPMIIVKLISLMEYEFFMDYIHHSDLSNNKYLDTQIQLNTLKSLKLETFNRRKINANRILYDNQHTADS
jgi:hypothetical protein